MCAAEPWTGREGTLTELTPGECEAPTVLLSTHKGLRPGEGKRTAARKSQSPVSPWLVRNCGNQPVKDHTEGVIFWVTALEKKMGWRVCSSADRSREWDKTVWYSLRPPRNVCGIVGLQRQTDVGASLASITYWLWARYSVSLSFGSLICRKEAKNTYPIRLLWILDKKMVFFHWVRAVIVRELFVFTHCL